ncbi:glycogen/starch/alpha-glucan phosphorylase [Rivularia sp. UHCC 0363]|uniref:glycogen/starch/alpha-glucan phosphorylase n=1 Tax=Rivularia sp. UHCC 0363 TaxID=3110244 RepID=UPI002B21CB70|nr:glycogen/starch/alpha-glucan phosphorylase [Rivularia sp. UHCC 0363]MEA5597448.1 glycogen/starch/alpha-glucan phosphorylase [Rivularia sp. UHCC 0363]
MNQVESLFESHMKFLDLAMLSPLLLLGLGLLRGSRSKPTADSSGLVGEELPSAHIDLSAEPLISTSQLTAVPAQVQLNGLMGDQTEMPADTATDNQQPIKDIPEIQITNPQAKTIADAAMTDSEPASSAARELKDTGPSRKTAGTATEEPAILPLIPLGDLISNSDIAVFKQAFTTNLARRGQSIQSATAADCYALLAEMLRDRLLQIRLDYAPVEGKRQVVQIASAYSLGMPLENHFTNLNITQPIQQGLTELGLNLVAICQQDRALGWDDEALGCLVGSELESLTTAQMPAIGYGLHSQLNPAAADPNPWALPQPEQSLEVKFGGYTEVYIDAAGHCRHDWMAAEIARALPYDLPISGYPTKDLAGDLAGDLDHEGPSLPRVGLLRLWQVSPAISPLANADPAELKLRQDFLLAACAVQDLLRQHLQALPLTDLPQHWLLQLNGTATGLAIAELMHQLVDQQQLGWDLAWEITQAMTCCRLHDWVEARGHALNYPLGLLHQLLPRHLEIIHEINRRFLDAARLQRSSPDEEQIGRLSLVEADWLRTSHLAAVGSHRLSGSGALQTQWLQDQLSEFSLLYPGKFQPQTMGITPRRFLLQTHPALAQLITQWLDDSWITHPEQLQRLQPLVKEAEFCSRWWQVHRAAKQLLAEKIQQKTGLTVNPSSLFDIQAGAIESRSRQLLQLLHVVTLYARIKTNSSTDTIQRFMHRSLPRTCIFVGQPTADPVAQMTADLIEAVATTINQDAALQGRLQVVLLADGNLQLMRWLYPAADLAEQLMLAGESAVTVAGLKFAMSGAVTIGMPSYGNLELQQAVGAKNIFLAGLTVAEVQRCRADYRPKAQYDGNPDLRQAIDLIASGYFSQGDGRFRSLTDWLLQQDPELILADYAAYIAAQERVSQVCQDQKNWVWMSILTVANSGQFSSDHSITAYEA